jgi:hypothetical protein
MNLYEHHSVQTELSYGVSSSTYDTIIHVIVNTNFEEISSEYKFLII